MATISPPAPSSKTSDCNVVLARADTMLMQGSLRLERAVQTNVSRPL